MIISTFLDYRDINISFQCSCIFLALHAPFMKSSDRVVSKAWPKCIPSACTCCEGISGQVLKDPFSIVMINLFLVQFVGWLRVFLGPICHSNVPQQRNNFCFIFKARPAFRFLSTNVQCKKLRRKWFLKANSHAQNRYDSALGKRILDNTDWTKMYTDQILGLLIFSSFHA